MEPLNGQAVQIAETASSNPLNDYRPVLNFVKEVNVLWERTDIGMPGHRPKEVLNKFGLLWQGTNEILAGNDPNDTRIKASTLSEVIERAPTEICFFMEGLIQKGALHGVMAVPKAGKSLNVLATAYHIATGTSFGPFSVPSPRKVMVINYEDGDFRMAQRGVGLQAGLQLPDPGENLLIVDDPFQISLDSDEGLDRLTKFVLDNGIEVVVIDPFANCHTAKESEADEMKVIMSRLRKLIRDTESAVIVVHHTRKSGTGGDMGRTQERGRGSSAIAAAFDVIITFGTSPEKGLTNVSVIAKDFETPDFALRCVRTDDQIKVTVEDVMEREDVTDRREVIFKALSQLSETAPEGVSAALISDATTFSLNTIKDHLEALARAKKTELCSKRGHKGAKLWLPRKEKAS